MKRQFNFMRSYALAIPVVLIGQAAFANMYDDCDNAIMNGELEVVRGLADQMVRFNSVTDPEKQSAGARCLTFAKGEVWTYSISQDAFVTKAQNAAEIASRRADAARLLAKRQELEEATVAAEAARKIAEESVKQGKLEREIAVWHGVLKACTEIYSDDPIAALTNRVCVDLFLQTGLPEE